MGSSASSVSGRTERGGRPESSRWFLLLRHGTARQHGVPVTAAASFSGDGQGCSGGDKLLRQRRRGHTRRQQSPLSRIDATETRIFCLYSGLLSAMAHQRSEPISFLQHEIRTLLVAFSSLLLGEDDRAQNLHSGSDQETETGFSVCRKQNQSLPQFLL
ncbi:hypothetical protein MRB53_027258 [Persea americana]|uniref:Uncharacterized protein n=1 Tax=Persea americana TaxID=3435 RepID=A0ACC2LKH6_PERAE|nr:hypothetical protein MRB53_027258 [Persea americana]